MKINKLLADSRNFSKGRKQNIQYLVIHYTANNGDTAKGNCSYFKNGERGASAHYFVDEREIWQSVEDNNTAWHCGTKGKYYHNKCRNENAIGIEMCSRKDSKGKYYIEKETFNNTVKLVKILMEKYNITRDKILRHYDVTHKNCPAPFVENTVLFNNFLKELEEEEYMKLKRIYKYGSKKKEFIVINDKGENYIKLRDFAELLDKQVDYNNDNKLTTIF